MDKTQAEKIERRKKIGGGGKYDFDIRYEITEGRAVRSVEDGKTTYEAEVLVGGIFWVPAETAKMMALNIQKAAEVAWALEDELRREFDPPAEKLARG